MDRSAYVGCYLEESSDEVARICHPLFQHTPIKYFDWSRYYDNGELFSLSSNAEFVLSSIKNQLVPSHSLFSIMHAQRVSTIILSQCILPPPHQIPTLNTLIHKNIAIGADLKLYHRFYIHERGLNYYDFYGFGTDNSSSEILNYYFNCHSTLRKFVTYFEREADHLIASSRINKFLYIPEKIIVPEENMPNSTHDITKLQTILETHDPMYIFPELTPREFQCYQYYANGFTSKYIAKQLHLHYRTVQDTIDRIKSKLKVRTKNQLIELWNMRFRTKF